MQLAEFESERLIWFELEYLAGLDWSGLRS